jgi:hypothetical protein
MAQRFTRILLILMLSMIKLEPVWACAVCGDGKEESRWAFMWTTGFLTLLPLCMVFGFFWWFRRRFNTWYAQQELEDGPRPDSSHLPS